jgi:adenosylcobinamide-GDP ribazoletransferase
MTILRSIAMAFTTFSRLPVPAVRWEKENMRYMLCAFPLVGVVIAVFTGAFWLIADAFGFTSSLVYAAGITILPVLVTGGIHMDGFCDTVDAISSNAPPSKRREILHDVHTGAFAVIFTAVYFAAYLALASELRDIAPLLVFMISFITTRALSGLCVLLLPSSSPDGLASAFKASADTRVSVIILFCVLVAGALLTALLNPIAAAVLITPSALCVMGVRFTAAKLFGGFSGDLAGFFLQLCELACLLTIVIFSKAGII